LYAPHHLKAAYQLQLLNSGFSDDAHARYAMESSYGATNLAMFKAVAKKYPEWLAETILQDLVAS
jgi:hypothetical protein